MSSKSNPAVGYIRMSTDKQEDSPRRKERVRAEILPRFPFSLATSTSIRAPSYTKREPLVIQFKTTNQAQLDGIVATLEEL